MGTNLADWVSAIRYIRTKIKKCWWVVNSVRNFSITLVTLYQIQVRRNLANSSRFVILVFRYFNVKRSWRNLFWHRRLFLLPMAASDFYLHFADTFGSESSRKKGELAQIILWHTFSCCDEFASFALLWRLLEVDFPFRSRGFTGSVQNVCKNFGTISEFRSSKLFFRMTRTGKTVRF